jgi:hypothetical protein
MNRLYFGVVINGCRGLAPVGLFKSRKIREGTVRLARIRFLQAQISCCHVPPLFQ